MKIAVIAANGRLGKAFVQEALASGHTVRAGIRGTDYSLTHDNLEIVRCDATKQDEVEDLICGQDVVVSCIGHVKGSPADVQTVATNAIVQAMNAQDIKRFVDVTGTGARMHGDKVTLIDWLLNVVVKLVDPDRIKDGENHMHVLEQSNLEWTTIRVLKLQNIQPKPYSLLPNGPTKVLVGRQEAAKAMLQVITEHSYICQAPIVGSARK